MLISFLLLHLQCAIAIDLIPQDVVLGYGLWGFLPVYRAPIKKAGL